MKAALLIRVSDPKQKEGSPEAQLGRITEYINKLSLVPVREFNFDETAYHQERRKNFKELVEWIKVQKEPIALVADKVDRLARGFSEDLLHLYYHLVRKEGKVELHFPNDWLVVTKDSPAVIEAQFFRSISDAQYSSSSTRDNVNRIIDHLAKQGRWLTRAPVGYRWKRWIAADGKTLLKTLELHPDEEPYIRQGFNLLKTQNITWSELVRFLNHHGIAITDSNIRKTFSNPFYCGFRVWKEEWIPHPYPKIIDIETYQAIQDRKPVQYHTTKHSYTMSGLVRCKHCGYCMIVYEKKNNVYVRCNACNVNVREDFLFNQLLEHLEFNLDSKTIEEYVERYHREEEVGDKQSRDRTKKLEKDLERTRQDITETIQMRARGEMSQESFQIALRAFEKHATVVDEQIKEMGQMAKPTKFYLTVEKLLFILQNARDILVKSSPEDRRAILRSFVHEAYYGRDVGFHFRLKAWGEKIRAVQSISPMVHHRGKVELCFNPYANELVTLTDQIDRIFRKEVRSFCVGKIPGGEYGRLGQAT